MGVPYSAATARNWLRKGGVTQRLCAAPSARPRPHVPTHCSHARWVAAPPWVARRLPGRHSSVTASPLRCRSGLFSRGAEAKEGRHLVSSAGLFARRHEKTLPLSSLWERLSHDRTTVRHWQRLGSTGSTSRGPSTPTVAVRLSSVLSIVEVDQAGTGDSHWVHSRPVRCVVGTVGRRCGNGVGVLDDWGWSDPGTLLGVPSPPPSEGRPLLAVSGSSRGWPAHVS